MIQFFDEKILSSTGMPMSFTSISDFCYLLSTEFCFKQTTTYCIIVRREVNALNGSKLRIVGTVALSMDLLNRISSHENTLPINFSLYLVTRSMSSVYIKVKM